MTFSAAFDPNIVATPEAGLSFSSSFSDAFYGGGAESAPLEEGSPFSSSFSDAFYGGVVEGSTGVEPPSTDNRFIFDGLSRRIYLNGVINVEAIELYSAWKLWVLTEPRWLPAFRTVGGDNTVAGQFAPRYYFLINGWKIVVDGIDVTFKTNLYSEEGDSPIITLNGGTAKLNNSDSPVVAADGGSSSVVDLTNIESTLVNIQTALNSLNTTGIAVDLSSVDTKLDTLQASVDNIPTADLTNINTKLDTLQTSVDNIPTTDLTAINTKLDSIQILVNNIPTTDLAIDIESLHTKLLEVWKILGLDPSNMQQVTPTSITVGDIVLSISSTEDLVTVARQ